MNPPSDETIALINKNPLTKDQLTILKLIRNGADVWGYVDAGVIRGLEKTHGSLINIVKAVADPPGHERQPYFGAICTLEGKRLLAWLNNPAWPFKSKHWAFIWRKQGQ